MTDEKKEDLQIQVAADAKANVRFVDTNVEGHEGQEFEASRNMTLLGPALGEALEEYLKTVDKTMQDTEYVDKIMVSVAIKGFVVGTEDEASWELIKEESANEVGKYLVAKAITPDEAVWASRNFFSEMQDMVDVKAILNVMVFAKGQSSYVMINKGVPQEDEHVLRTIATTVMQLDKFKDEMAKAGVAIPGAAQAGNIILPGAAGFPG